MYFFAAIPRRHTKKCCPFLDRRRCKVGYVGNRSAIIEMHAPTVIRYLEYACRKKAAPPKQRALAYAPVAAEITCGFSDALGAACLGLARTFAHRDRGPEVSPARRGADSRRSCGMLRTRYGWPTGRSVFTAGFRRGGLYVPRPVVGHASTAYSWPRLIPNIRVSVWIRFMATAPLFRLIMASRT